MHLHWDGNNTSLQERNLSAARAVGGTDDSLDIDQLDRVADWLLDLPPPVFPADRIDRGLADQGERVYDQQCASCHDLDGARVGQVTPIEEIGTDRARLDNFTPELVAEMNTIGKGKPWRFRQLPQDERLRERACSTGSGYALPTCTTAASRRCARSSSRTSGPPSSTRATTSTTGRTSASSPPARPQSAKDSASTRACVGNGNEGHLYGTKLPAAQRLAIIEYLKTK